MLVDQDAEHAVEPTKNEAVVGLVSVKGQKSFVKASPMIMWNGCVALCKQIYFAV